MTRLAQKQLQIPISLIWFLFVYGVLVATINTADTWNFNLQHIGIEALGERGTWYFEGSSHPHLQPEGDIFVYKGHTYACKQPGQFVFGGVVYRLLRVFGFSYALDYILTASTITALTSAFLAALMAMFLFQIANYYLSLRRSLLVSALGVFGTTIWPYAGVTHHDLFGTFFAFFGFYLLFYAHRMQAQMGEMKKAAYIATAGFLSFFTFFSSLLPFGCVLATGVYLLCLRRWTGCVIFLCAGLFALAPTLLYNVFVFDDLFHFPHVIGGYDVALPRWSWSNFIEKLDFYLISLTNSFYMFSPFLVFALLGFVHWPKEHGAERVALLAACLLTFVHVCSMQTIGHAQYGPRYLLPIMPFMTLGLIGLLGTQTYTHQFLGVRRRVWTGLLLFLGGISVCVAGVGSLMGVMFKPVYLHPFPLYVGALLDGKAPQFLFAPLGLLFVLAAVFIGWRQKTWVSYD
ncbi:MAG: hypothetical protein QGI45_02730 [Myxococcota bacterium]|jgi:hypothetical protein|nr:hypothetical protein [Myxococcota bacterium]